MAKYVDFISDMHMEINGNVETDIIFNSKKTMNDVLVLDGDITCYRYFDPKRTDPESRSMRKRFVKFIQGPKCKHYQTILYIPGNHEYYGHYWAGADQLFQEHIRTIDSRLIVMQNDTYTNDNVTIFGATLWTDFDKGDPLTILAVEGGLNDYHVVKAEQDSKQKLLGYMTQEAHHKSLEALKVSYENRERNKKFIVVTHHGPSLQSHSDQFGNTPLKYGFLSDLDNLIFDRNIDYWIHGHSHFNIDYKIGDTQIISCMYGYLGMDKPLSNRKLKIGRITI